MYIYGQLILFLVDHAVIASQARIYFHEKKVSENIEAQNMSNVSGNRPTKARFQRKKHYKISR